MYISTDEAGLAKTSLTNDHWSGMTQGTDKYPKQKNGYYFISGSDTEWLKVTKVEFYGFNINKWGW